GAFDTGPIKHRVSFGGDYRDSDQSRQFARGENTNGLTVPLFNIRMPSYTLSDEFSLEGVAVDSFTEEDLGAFLNVYSELTDRLGLLLGIRYSETESRNFFPDFNVENLLESEGWSPMVGVSFRITDNTALYGSYSESFTPNDVVPDFEGTVELIDPEIGEQFELGIKAEFFDGRAQASLAVYQIEKTNVVIGSDELGRPILAEGSTSDGIEFGIAGQPLPGMNLTASYAYIDAKTSAGVAAPGVADQLFNVYASYEWQGGTLEGLGVGGGIYYEAERFVDVAGLVELDDYMLVDLSTWYTIETPRIFGDAGTIRFQVALKNIFDETYYGGGSGVALRIPLGVPRSVFGSVSFDI
ncbi:MAG: TonB-dependent receptor, partial [Pseudomonadota bacterium]